jgi:hypothetical protein
MWTATALALPYVPAPSMANLTGSTLALVPSLWRAEGRAGHQPPGQASWRHVRFVMAGPGGCHRDW